MYRAIIFDMDGVLIDSEPLYHVSDRKFFDFLNMTLTEEDIISMTGCSGTVIANKILSKNKNLPYSAEELAETYDRYIANALYGCKDLTLTNGAENWIRNLSEIGVKLAVGSSSTHEMVHYVLDRFDITKYFDAVVTSSEVKLTKPYPDIFLECAKRLETDPRYCLVIEDSLNGMKAAHSAGMKCAIYLETNEFPIDLSRFDEIIDSFSPDKLEYIKSLCQEIR
ncbi:MAG: HAD family phosphatase [Clostridiales bacterium]|nr:HAD family phosphatase [Clostridiales bacterium]